jgi:carbamoyl-phosphate synthase large subunit
MHGIYAPNTPAPSPSPTLKSNHSSPSSILKLPKSPIHYVDADPQLKYLYPDLNFHLCPMISDNNYWIVIKKLIDQYGIDFYIPLIDEEIIFAKRNVEGFSGVKVISPTADFSELCLNKFELMLRLDNENISDVISYTGDNYHSELGFPIFIKPISGRGSRGIMKINNQSQLDAYYMLEGYLPNEILIQPLLTGVEYTVGVLTNNLNNLLSISSKRIIKKKQRIKNDLKFVLSRKRKFLESILKRYIILSLG